jgi:hypothetical protein
MKKSELKEMIRQAMLAEINEEGMVEDTGAAVTDKMYDPVSEAEEEETDTETTDTETTDTTDTETTDTETTDTETTDTEEEDPNVTKDDIQQSLEGALEAAKKLGDEKLIDQIGNTITFFTRTHVSSGGEALQEADEMEEGYYGSTNVETFINVLGYESFEEFLNDNPGAEDALIEWIESIPEFRKMLMQKGMMESKKEYYKDAEADDAKHIKALKKDMEDDKYSSMKINENEIRLWQIRAGIIK